MFESQLMYGRGIDVRLSAVAGPRDGWHGRPSLRSLMTLTPDELTADEALSALAALQQERGRIDSLEADLLVRAAGATRVVRDVLVEEADPARTRTVTMVDEVTDEIAVVLRRPVHRLQESLADARLLHGPLRRTRESVAAGLITIDHARAICRQAARMMTAPLGEDAAADDDFAGRCAQLQDRVLGRAPEETPVETRERARRAVASIDAEGARQRRRRARCTRDVRVWGEDDGLGVVMARLTASDAAWVGARVEAHARAHANDGSLGTDPDATWGEVRAAALLDLMRGPTCPPDQAYSPTVEIGVVIDLSTLVGLTPDLPAAVDVSTWSRAELDRDDVLALMADGTTPVTLRRLVREPLTGALVDRGAHRYQASPDLVAWLAARDVTCRHPGCTRRARTCDVDHAIDFDDGGRTTRANTGLLCRRHHNGKTHSGWRVEDSRPDGSCTIVSPTGRRFPHAPPEISPGRSADPAADPPVHESPSADDPPDAPFPF